MQITKKKKNVIFIFFTKIDMNMKNQIVSYDIFLILNNIYVHLYINIKKVLIIVTFQFFCQ